MMWGLHMATQVSFGILGAGQHKHEHLFYVRRFLQILLL